MHDAVWWLLAPSLGLADRHIAVQASLGNMFLLSKTSCARSNKFSRSLEDARSSLAPCGLELRDVPPKAGAPLLRCSAPLRLSSGPSEGLAVQPGLQGFSIGDVTYGEKQGMSMYIALQAIAAGLPMLETNRCAAGSAALGRNELAQPCEV